MKCPACSCTSSNKWDSCPKCGLDLRPHKKALNIAISHPSLSIKDIRNLEHSSAAKAAAENTPASTPTEAPLPPSPPRATSQVKERKTWLKSIFDSSSSSETNELVAAQEERKTITPPIQEQAATSKLPEAKSEPPKPSRISLCDAAEDAIDETLLDKAINASIAANASFFETEEQQRSFGGDFAQESTEDDSPLFFPDELPAASAGSPLSTIPTPSESPTSTPHVRPAVMEFNEDDDELFERQLDALIGDAMLDIQAVPEKKPLKEKSSATASASNNSFFVDDDLEVSFEIESDLDEENSFEEDASEEDAEDENFNDTNDEENFEDDLDDDKPLAHLLRDLEAELDEPLVRTQQDSQVGISLGHETDISSIEDSALVSPPLLDNASSVIDAHHAKPPAGIDYQIELPATLSTALSTTATTHSNSSLPDLKDLVGVLIDLLAEAHDVPRNELDCLVHGTSDIEAIREGIAELKKKELLLN
ncbi:MAG: hypothetical protein IT291_10265 [Deltaproteobacteria bacterium]|nr:hypothetical protein [Deltaproteobacteria bacterium]